MLIPYVSISSPQLSYWFSQWGFRQSYPSAFIPLKLLPMEPYRLNSPDTSAIMLEVLGHQLQFSQDPNSKHLGTTVWDASMIFAKYLEKNCRKGRFCASKLKGKRVIELGAGCGVAGFAMALLGCDVVSTDQTEVLPLLIRNAERNTSRIMQKDPGLVDSFGSINVAELNWGIEDHIRAVDPPFDYIIGTDVVYAEHLLEPLLRTIIALSGPKTTFLLGYEIRSTNVHEQMLELWKRNFEVKVVPRRKMDIKYQHSSIQLYIMTLKPQVRTSAPIECSDEKTEETETQCSDEEKTEETDEVDMVGVGDSSRGDNKAIDSKDEKANADADPVISVPDKMLTEWEARRYGAMAARLLRDVQIQ